MLIMDEPTSALSASEVEVLFGVIDELTDGRCRHRLHLPPPRGGARDRRPCRRVPRWRARRPGAGRRDRHRVGDLDAWSAARRTSWPSTSATVLGEPVLSLRDVEVVDPSNPGVSPSPASRLDVRGRRARVPVRPDGRRAHGTARGGRRQPPVARGTVDPRRSDADRRVDRRAHRSRARPRARGPSARRPGADDVGGPQPVAGQPAVVRAPAAHVVARRAHAPWHRSIGRDARQGGRATGADHLALGRQPAEGRHRPGVDDEATGACCSTSRPAASMSAPSRRSSR